MLKDNCFIERFKEYKAIQASQKEKGLNDFNILTTVLKYHDEVRLHSRMIGSLLDPKGKHYRNILFLKDFLKELELDTWSVDLYNTKVQIEYRDIDLYLTDGKKHLIIENKIWAEDQPCQIIKYINIIVEENKDEFGNPDEDSFLDDDLIRVVYLTPRNKEVSSGHHIIRNNDKEYITFGQEKEKLKRYSDDMNRAKTLDFMLKNYKARYQKINYHTIYHWLQKSQTKIKDITNLNEALNQYIEVVKKVNKQYKGNIMSLNDYLKEIESDKHTYAQTIELLFKEHDEIEILQGELLYEFFDSNILYKNEELERADGLLRKDKNGLVYTKNKCKSWFETPSGKRKTGKDKDFGTFYKLNDNYLLLLFLGKENLHFGIVKHNNFEIQDLDTYAGEFRLKERNFKSINLKWFSKEYVLLNNLDIFSDYQESKFYKDLQAFLEDFFN